MSQGPGAGRIPRTVSAYVTRRRSVSRLGLGHDPSVDAHDRHHLRRRAGEERLRRTSPDPRASKRARGRNAERARDLEHRAPRDAFEDVGRGVVGRSRRRRTPGRCSRRCPRRSSPRSLSRIASSKPARERVGEREDRVGVMTAGFHPGRQRRRRRLHDRRYRRGAARRFFTFDQTAERQAPLPARAFRTRAPARGAPCRRRRSQRANVGGIAAARLRDFDHDFAEALDRVTEFPDRTCARRGYSRSTCSRSRKIAGPRGVG